MSSNFAPTEKIQVKTLGQNFAGAKFDGFAFTSQLNLSEQPQLA
jgi:hypothetical protein